VSVFLAWFLAARRAELAGKTVVELGAGAGLSGLVASKFACVAAARCLLENDARLTSLLLLLLLHP
jgi:predicted nicotinamide N-methyase